MSVFAPDIVAHTHVCVCACVYVCVHLHLGVPQDLVSHGWVKLQASQRARTYNVGEVGS